jgi:hypothetical protein
MVDNKTLGLISYRIGDSISMGGSRTAPTRFDTTTFLQLPITILSSESFIPRVYDSDDLVFSSYFSSKPPDRTVEISAHQSC